MKKLLTLALSAVFALGCNNSQNQEPNPNIKRYGLYNSFQCYGEPCFRKTGEIYLTPDESVPGYYDYILRNYTMERLFEPEFAVWYEGRCTITEDRGHFPPITLNPPVGAIVLPKDVTEEELLFPICPCGN